MFKAFLRKILVSAALIPFLAHGQTRQSYAPPVFENADRLEKIKAVFPVIAKIYKDYAEASHFPGYSFGIVLDGDLVYSGSGGYADLNKKTPVTTQSMFRIASMTKSFTAMAILKLRDEGKLKLDDPVYLYLPELQSQKLTQDAPELTIRNLLTHSAGFPTDDPWGDRKLAETDKDLQDLFKNGVSFSNEPGTVYEYSNLGFATLGYIIKKVTGQSYQSYIARHIWQPLEMKAAAWEFTHIPAPQLVHGYKWSDGAWTEEPLLHDGSYGAMGGMFTSIEAFSRYVALHLAAWPPRDGSDLGPIKRSSIREMHQAWRFDELIAPYKYPDGSEGALNKAYGYGVSCLHDSRGRFYVEHSGGLPGFGSNWVILPEYGLGVIFFANLTYAAASTVNFQVLDILVKDAHLQPRQVVASKLLKERQQALLKLLPEWKNAEASGLFAANFFLDHSPGSLKKETKTIFSNAGKTLSVGPLIALNQLQGFFIIHGEKAKIKISFWLSPENPALIQKYEITNTVN